MVFPTRGRLSYFHNVGSALGVFYLSQVLTGLLLVIYYEASPQKGYISINQTIIIETGNGWLIRLIHFNGARWLFILAYLHVRKAIFFMSWRLTKTWLRGVILLLILIASAFLGYSLLASQMSYWAGVVIRGLLGVLRSKVVYFLWGSYTFGENALKIFFEAHFILPLIMGAVIAYHLTSLHEYGRTSLLGLPQRLEAEAFYPVY